MSETVWKKGDKTHSPPANGDSEGKRANYKKEAFEDIVAKLHGLQYQLSDYNYYHNCNASERELLCKAEDHLVQVVVKTKVSYVGNEED